MRKRGAKGLEKSDWTSASSKSSDSETESDVDDDDDDDECKLSRALIKNSRQCRLECLLRASIEDYPVAHLLLSAHLQLDTLHASTKWSILLKALKEITIESRKGKQGDSKSYNRLNKGSAYPQAIWTASIVRLHARLDLTLTNLKEDACIRSHSESLSADDSKALFACLQIWRKTIRGRYDNHNADLSGTQRQVTALEASILCRRAEAARLVLCLHDDDIDLLELKKNLANLIGFDKDGQRWKSLEICANNSRQAKRGIECVLTQSSFFRSITLRRHDDDRANELKELEGGNETLLKGKLVSLPPHIILNKSLQDVDNTFTRDDDDIPFLRSDYMQALSSLSSKGLLSRCFQQPPRLATLSSMASLVIRRYDLDISTLPVHLYERARSATFCSSCARIMTNERLSVSKTPSHASRRQAIKAGFTMSKPSKDEAVESLSAGRPYLPPLSEEVCILARPTLQPSSDSNLADSARSFTTSIGGSELVSGWQWQFCAFCCASHIGVISSKHCRCLLCANKERVKQKPLQSVGRVYLGEVTLSTAPGCRDESFLLYSV